MQISNDDDYQKALGELKRLPAPGEGPEADEGPEAERRRELQAAVEAYALEIADRDPRKAKPFRRTRSTPA